MTERGPMGIFEGYGEFDHVPRHEGGPIPPQPQALWSPRTIAQERVVLAAVLHWLSCPMLDGQCSIRDAHEIVADIIAARLRRGGP